ncbi:unnamed protein product [Rotaria magnacalcarata]|uniref:Ubiquitin-like domain-containing protein n=3 Tax=Rotaria magnacalcarata TaxID=392030 RepID=A0A816QFX2_9BILA|nr:unnamed protein product [Rotaria magnacalcarata]
MHFLKLQIQHGGDIHEMILTTNSNDPTVEELLRHIEKQLNIPMDEQHVVFKGQSLQENPQGKLRRYGITNATLIRVVGLYSFGKKSCIIIDHPNRNNVYHDVSHGYAGKNVTPMNFINVLTGNEQVLNVKINDDHNHPSEKETIEVRDFRENIKQRAINETTPIPRIYDEECAKAKLSDTTTVILPSGREMNSAINKARRASTPTIPTTQLFDIPEPFTKTLHDDDFLIVDKMITRRQRILLFASREQLKMLLGADTILMDGTFSTCPTQVDQNGRFRPT